MDESHTLDSVVIPIPGGLGKDIAIASLLAIAAFTLFILPALCGRPVHATPEARIAVVAREMLQSGNWVVPRLGGEVRLIKPPLPYWLTAIAAESIGLIDNENNLERMTRAVEIPPAFLSALAVFIVAIHGCRAFGRAAGISAGIILGLSSMLVNYSWLGYCDTTLMCACTGMFCSAAWLLGSTLPRIDARSVLLAISFGISLGLGVLAKWYIPAALIAAPLFAEICLRRRFNANKVLLFTLGFFVAAGVIAPWFVLVEQRLPGALGLIGGGVELSTEAIKHIPDYRWLHYFMKLGGGLLPWTPVLLCAWAVCIKKYFDKAERIVAPAATTGSIEIERLAREHFRFFTLAFGLGFLAFYSQAKQQGYYLLPIFPPLVLASVYAMRISFSASTRIRKYGRTAVTVSAVVALMAYMGWAGWAVIFIKKSRAETMPMENERLHTELDAMGKNLKIFATGPIHQAVLMFYLERPVYTLEKLAREPDDAGGMPQPKRVLFASQKAIRQLKIESYFQGKKDEPVLRTLSKELQAELKTYRQKYSEMPGEPED